MPKFKPNFRREWGTSELFSSWLIRVDGGSKARCKYCECDFADSSNGALIQHLRSKGHKNATSGNSNSEDSVPIMCATKIRPDSDCYYYYYSTCTKGTRCPYRHEPAAFKNENVCSFWLKGRCGVPNCTFRHMHLSKDRSKIPCYYESQPSGCEKTYCPYLHKKDFRSSKSLTGTPLLKGFSSGFGSGFEGKLKNRERARSREQSVNSPDREGKINQRGAKSLQSLMGQPIKVPFYDGRQSSRDLTGPNLAKCLSEFDGYEATLLTLLRNFKFSPEHTEQLVSENSLSFQMSEEMVCLKPQINICLHHLKEEGCQNSSVCYFIHICLKYIIGDCFEKDCLYGHRWQTDHNEKVLKEFNLQQLSSDKLNHLFKTVVIPNSTKTKLNICSKYNSGDCQNEDCQFLHVCLKFLAQQCSSNDCKLSHNIRDSKVAYILNLHGISTSAKEKDILLRIINTPSINHSIKSLSEDSYMKLEDSKINNSKSTAENTSDVQSPITKWAYDLEGTTKVHEICYDSVESFCSHEMSGCDKLHCSFHFYWQVKIPDESANKNWINFPEKQVIFLEKAYCNPNISTAQLPPLDPSNSKKELLIILKGRSLWEANFKTMKISLVGGKEVLEIRRLCSKACKFKWYFCDINNIWIEYGNWDSTDKQLFSTIDSTYIENEYNTKSSVDFKVGNCSYTLFFKDMSQKNIQTGIVRKVRRRPVLLLKNENSESDLPSIWEPMNLEERCRRVTLNSSSDEYKKIFNLVQTRANGTVYTILKIERVQNPYLYRAFQNKVQEMKVTYKNDSLIDIRQLFHGTGSDIVPKICNENFDWRLHGTANAQAFGRGTYFAMQSSYSYAYAKLDANKQRFMFVAKVAVGTIIQGNSGITRPPINTQYNLPYDSTVDNVANPTIIVKYEKQEYYPEYIVTMN